MLQDKLTSLQMPSKTKFLPNISDRKRKKYNQIEYWKKYTNQRKNPLLLYKFLLGMSSISDTIF